MSVNYIIYNLANLLRKLGIHFNEESDKRVIKMKKEIAKLGKIEFKIDHYPDGSWAAESVNIDGIITGGMNSKQMGFLIRDAIFTYFEIPAHLCQDSLLRSDNEPITLKQHVYA